MALPSFCIKKVGGSILIEDLDILIKILKQRKKDLLFVQYI